MDSDPVTAQKRNSTGYFEEKSPKRLKVLSEDVSLPASASTSTIVSPAAVANQWNFSGQNEGGSPKIKLESEPVSDGEFLPQNVKQEEPIRGEPITAKMLYGPLGLNQPWAAVSSKGSHKTKILPDNIRDGLHDDLAAPDHEEDTTSRSSSTEKKENTKPKIFEYQVVHPAKIEHPQGTMFNLNRPSTARRGAPSIEVTKPVEIPDDNPDPINLSKVGVNIFL